MAKDGDDFFDNFGIKPSFCSHRNLQNFRQHLLAVDSANPTTVSRGEEEEKRQFEERNNLQDFYFEKPRYAQAPKAGSLPLP